MMNLTRCQKVDVDDLIKIGLYRSREVSEVDVDELIFMHPIVKRGLVTRKEAKSQGCIKPKLLTEPPMRRLDGLLMNFGMPAARIRP